MSRAIQWLASLIAVIEVLDPVSAVAQVTAAPMPPAPAVSGGFPRVSSKGDRLIFRGTEGDTVRLLIANAVGDSVRTLSPPGVRASYGEWFRSGEEVAYVGIDATGRAVHIVNLRTLVDVVVPNTGGANGISVSPDGSTLVFPGGTFPNVHLFLVQRDGTGLRQLTTDAGFHSYPAWSPDGKQIAYSGSGGERASHVYVVNTDGTGAHRVSTLAAMEETPAWSADGQYVAFQGSVQGKHLAHVYVGRADGTEVRQITHQEALYLTETPSFFPDGKTIAIQSDKDGVMAAYVIDLNGTFIRRLTK